MPECKIALPSLDIVTLGAGGGSIGKLDRSGLLTVGPDSAGAAPGPACYGQGGTGATVTDANLVLGYLDPANFLGGRRRSGSGCGDEGRGEHWHAELGMETDEAAAGILRVVNSRMADGVRVATVRRGVDPRGFTLLAFGGAAGLHVTAVAAELGISRVAVPLAASVLSAWGMLNTDLRVELSRSQGQSGQPRHRRAENGVLRRWRNEGRARLAWFDGEVTLHRSADMRYGEQVFEIPVGLDGVDWASPALAANLADRFHAAHERLYTYALRDQEAVLVNARLSVIGRLPQVERAVLGCFGGGGQTKGATPDLSWRLDRGACIRLSRARRQTSAFVGRPSWSPTPRPSCCAPATWRDFDARGWLEVVIDGSR